MTRFRCAFLVALPCMFNLSSRVAWGQNFVVQQPVIQFFQVDTVVSVPDGGSMRLGTVSRGETGANRFGPVPYGTASGRNTSTSFTDVRVWIHDLGELDRQLLEIGKRRFEQSHADDQAPANTRRGGPKFVTPR